MSVPNLDGMTEDELVAFWDKYHHGECREAFELIGDKRHGYIILAIDLANYALNKSTAMACSSLGRTAAAATYEWICNRIYRELPADLRW
jgi:hypothetical protein